MILFISALENTPWGGSEELWSQTAMRMAHAGEEVVAYVKGWPTPPKQWEELERSGVTLYRRDPRQHPGLPPIQAFPRFAVVSNGGNGVNAVPWLQMLAGHGIPYVVICQTAADFWWYPDDYANELGRLYRHAKRVFFVSRQNVRQTEFAVGGPLPNAEVVWNPYLTFAAPIAWPDTPIPRMACVARLEPAFKGQDVLFEVLAQPKWRERKFALTLYGGGAQQNTLRRIVDWLELKNLHFGGTVPPHEIWKREQMLVMPSRCEGLPLALVEAMLAGRPALVTDVGGNADVMEDGVTGFLVCAPKAPFVDEALERAWEGRAQWADMGKAAAESIRRILPPDPVGDFAARLKAISTE